VVRCRYNATRLLGTRHEFSSNSAQSIMVRSVNHLPLDVQRYIDSRCDEFEWAWKEGETPLLEQFLADSGAAARPHLVRELLAIELQYRRGDDGQVLAQSAAGNDRGVAAWRAGR
jgi:hypothetical protein